MTRVQLRMVALPTDKHKNVLQNVMLTFITTWIPFSARMRGANSDPLYASRLYLAFVANMAIAGGCPEYLNLISIPS